MTKMTTFYSFRLYPVHYSEKVTGIKTYQNEMAEIKSGFFDCAVHHFREKAMFFMVKRFVGQHLRLLGYPSPKPELFPMSKM